MRKILQRMKNIYIALIIFQLCSLFFFSCVNKEYTITEKYQEIEYRTEYSSEVYTDNQTSMNAISGEYELIPYFMWSSEDINFKDTPNLWYYAYNIPTSPAYDNIRLKVTVWEQLQYESAIIRIFDMTKAGHITHPDPAISGENDSKGVIVWPWIEGAASNSWLASANTMINQAKFLGGRTYLWSKSESSHVIELDAGKAQDIAVIISGPKNKWNARITLTAVWTSNIIEYNPVTKTRQIPRQIPYQIEKQRTVLNTRQVPFWETMFSP